MPFQRTTAINKLLAMKKRKRVVQGGTSAGKTVGIVAVLIDYAIKNPGKKITIVAETMPVIKNGALDIFKRIMQETGRWSDASYIANPIEYTFSNGTVIQFTSYDTVGKAEGAGKRDVLFINEAVNIPFAIAHALMVRSLQTWIDFNPKNTFWAHTEVMTSPSAEFLLLKYTDNECLPPETLEDILENIEKAKTSKYWANWVRVYVDGETGNLEGIIFENWAIKGDDMPGTLLGYGIDFGFVHSPTAIVQVNEFEGEIYIKEWFYKVGAHTDELFAFAQKNLDLKAQAIADSAEPRTIDDLFRRGWRGLKPAIKGEDSIRMGIEMLQQRKLNVTQSSLHLIKELRNYMWDTDKEGKPMNKPVKEYDHAVDAIRYLVSYPKKRTQLLSA